MKLKLIIAFLFPVLTFGQTIKESQVVNLISDLAAKYNTVSLLPDSSGFVINRQNGTKDTIVFTGIVNNGVSSSGGGGRSITNTYYTSDWGMVGDGVTDNTTAFQTLLNAIAATRQSAKIFVDVAGRYVFSGALQQTSTANSQIVYPFRSVDSSNLVIELIGTMPPPLQYFTYSLDPQGTQGYTIFESTLTGGAGTAAFISSGYEVRDALKQNNITPNFRNIFFKAPNNPSFTMLNLQNMQANILDGVHIYGGTLNCANVVQPTNANAYGVKLPDENHTPNTIVKNLRVMGFYWGMSMSESVFAEGVRISACYKGIDCQFGYHISEFKDLCIYWTPYGICASASRNDNINRLRVLAYGIEHHGSSGGAAWMNNIADVYDPSNYLLGDLVYVSVTGGIGNTSDAASFVKSGGSNFLCTRLGTIAYGSGVITPPTFSSGEVGNVSASTVVVNYSKPVKASNYASGVNITVNGTAATISSATRQATTSQVYYVLGTPVTGGQNVQYSYTALNGFITDASGNGMADVASTTVTNNLGVSYVHNSQFTAADNTNLTAYTPDAGNAWTPILGSALKIVSNRAVGLTDGGSGYKCLSDMGTASYTANAYVTRGAAANDVFMYVKANDANNLVAILFSGSGVSTVSVYNVVGGSASQVGGSTVYTPDAAGHVYKATVSGTTLTVYVDGTTIGTYTISSSLTGTKAGFGFTGTGTSCDYFTAN